MPSTSGVSASTNAGSRNAAESSANTQLRTKVLFGSDFPQDDEAEQELLNGLPFLEIQLVRQARFTILVERFFATDRQSIPKGMIEVML